MLRSYSISRTSLLLAAILFPGAAAAEENLLAGEAVELPAELPLNASAIVIELWNADVEVLADATARPVLRAAVTGDEPTQESVLERVEDGALTIRRPAGDETVRIRVDVVLGAEQELRLAGRGLSVIAREAQRPGVTAPLGLRLDLESSELDLDGGRDAVVEARDSAVFLARTRGLLTVTLESGSAQIRAHQGDLQLEAAAAEVALIGLGGKVESLLRGGSLDVREGNGRFTGNATDAVLLFEGWLGPLTLKGAGNTVDARGSGEKSPWKLEGADLQVTLEQIAGPVTVHFNGGRLRATEMAAILRGVATNRADVELTDLARGADLKLSAAATARLTDVAANLQIEANDAWVQADGVERLTLTGARSEIHASRVENVNRLEMSDSELDLDLSTVVRSSSWKLSGAGRATVRLPTPCMVILDGPRDLVGDQAEVSGCELRLPGQPVHSRQEFLIYGDRRPLTLSVTLDADVELEVEGRP